MMTGRTLPLYVPGKRVFLLAGRGKPGTSFLTFSVVIRCPFMLFGHNLYRWGLFLSGELQLMWYSLTVIVALVSTGTTAIHCFCCPDVG